MLGSYGVPYAKVKGTEKERGEEWGWEQRQERRGTDRGGRNGTRNGERVGRREQGRQQGPETKGVSWRRMCWSTGSPTREKGSIRFGTYNICNIRNGGLESALRGMSQANMYLGIFQGKKITHGIYNRGSAGYSVVATDAPSRHRGGVAMFYRPAPHFAVEAVQQFGPNAV